MNKFKDKYEGSKNKDGLPHGKGKMTFEADGKITLIEERDLEKWISSRRQFIWQSTK